MGDSLTQRRKLLEQSRVIRGKGIPSPFDLTNSMIEDEEPSAIEIVSDPNALVPKANGEYAYKRFTITPVGMIIPQDVTPDELLDVGSFVKGIESSIQWVVGDLINALEKVWGDSYKQVAEQLGYERSTVYQWAYVCRKVSIRIEKPLTFGHHQLVAKMSPEEQETWLRRAYEGNWSISQMRIEMSDHPTLSTDNVGRFQNKLTDLQKEYKKSSDFERTQMIVLLEDMLTKLRKG
jgi:transposase